MKNIFVLPTGSGECELRTWGSGKISNICGMKGYLTSPCLYKLSHFDMMKDPGNYVCKATIVGIEPVKKEIVKRCHSSCLEPVSVSRGSFSCETCEVKVMKEANLSKLKVRILVSLEIIFVIKELLSYFKDLDLT